ncbi:hypothetical protein AHAS_Ahas07G0152300 [Arachis hypogaea]
MINEWIHVTIGASGFDVLVREVGGEVYREECFRESKQGTWDRNRVDGGELQREEHGGILNKCDERPEVAWDLAAVLVMVDNRMAEQEKDILVNSCVNLNEWNHNNSNIYSGKGIYATLKEGEDSRGSSHINDEVDSEETISHDYYECNGNKARDGTRNGYGLVATRPIMGSKGNGAKGSIGQNGSSLVEPGMRQRWEVRDTKADSRLVLEEGYGQKLAPVEAAREKAAEMLAGRKISNGEAGTTWEKNGDAGREGVNGSAQEKERDHCTQSGLELGADLEGDTNIHSEEQRLSWKEKMNENKEAWKLAVESGAQCSNEEDIMPILQEQNEAMTLKQRHAKQKENVRRSRPET